MEDVQISFAANLGASAFAVGVLVILGLGLTFRQAIPILLIGNLAGGLGFGLAAAMGPALGFPQMIISRSAFGRKGNYLPAGLNWICTMGWFTFNTILGAMAMQAVIPGFNLYFGIAILIVIQTAIGILGHDMIHVFEKALAVLVGIVFLAFFILTLPRIGYAFSYVPPNGSADLASFGAIGATMALSFSFLISWAPYASDYSRYLPKRTSKLRIALLTMAGGAISSFCAELLGAIMAAIIRDPVSLAQNSSLFAGIVSFSGGLGTILLIVFVLGEIAANAINIYSNSLSTLALDQKARRWVTVGVGGVVGFVLAVVVGVNFVTDFESFLLVLDYWITPWLAIILVDFFISKRTEKTLRRNVKSVYWTVLVIYLISIAMGSLSGLLGGTDFSYFISFVIAGIAYFVYRKYGKN